MLDLETGARLRWTDEESVNEHHKLWCFFLSDCYLVMMWEDAYEALPLFRIRLTGALAGISQRGIYTH